MGTARKVKARGKAMAEATRLPSISHVVKAIIATNAKCRAAWTPPRSPTSHAKPAAASRIATDSEETGASCRNLSRSRQISHRLMG